MATPEKLSPRRRLLIGAVVAALASGGFVAGRHLLRPARVVRQPIEFNHLVHVEDVGMDCLTCHEHYETALHSGLPSLDVCAACHEEALTDSPQEARLIELIAEEPSAEFAKLFRMPDHVYYSHRRHTTVAGIECETCHGAIAAMTAPPPVALKRLTMAGCIECHERDGARTDCTSCHR